MNISDIKLLLTKCEDSTAYKKYVSELYEEKISEMESLEEQLVLLKATIKEIDDKTDFYYNGIVVKEIPTRQVAFIRKKITTYPAQDKLWKQIDEQLEIQKIKVTNPSYNIAYYHTSSERNIDVEVQRAVISNGVSNAMISFKNAVSILCATITFEGEYEILPKVGIAIANWLKDSNYQLAGPIFHIYHNAPRNENASQNRITEICYPLKEK